MRFCSRAGGCTVYIRQGRKKDQIFSAGVQEEAWRWCTDPQCTTFLVSRRPQPSLDGRTAISTIIFIIAFIIIIILIIFIGTITIIFVNILFLFCFCCLIIYQHCSSNMSEVKTDNCQEPEWFRCPEIYSFGGHKVTKSLLCISMYLINTPVLSA